MFENLNVRTDGDVRWIAVDRPETYNALNVETRTELRTALEAAAAEDGVRVIVITGENDSFISGADLNSIRDFDVLDALEYHAKHGQDLYNFIATLSKPTIAAIDGYALGGGLEVAVGCDIRLASDRSKFGLPEIDIGLFPSGGATQRMVHLVGLGRTKELVFTGEMIDSETARDIGLINRRYEADAFEAAVEDYAEDLASKPPVALRLAKESIDQNVSQSGLDFERLAGSILFGTDDATEGISAFLEDRDPEFTGK